ncbi:MAG: hypothetical protein ACSHW7_13690 [Patiriisocius sp.]
MNKTTKKLLIVIGILSILAGIVRYFQGDNIDLLLAFVIGITLFGSIYFTKSVNKKYIWFLKPIP